MGEVIQLSDIVASKSNGVRPKSESRSFSGQRYQLRFDPNAAENERWLWIVKFTRVYEYTGSCADIEKADKAARKRISELTQREQKAG